MIDLSINKVGLEHNIQKAKENHIIIPTIAQMQNPDLIPEKIKAKLSTTGLWDVDPVNLFRISWHNEAKESGGLFQAVPNYVEIPTKLSGVPCRIVAMSGKWFPTGCHKVGASFGCLAPRLVTGRLGLIVCMMRQCDHSISRFPLHFPERLIAERARHRLDGAAA